MAAKKTPSFEDRLRRLQEVVAALENGELPLEDSVRLYKEGLTLCSSFSSSRVPDPCPRCSQTPWNQRTEDTGSDADAFMPSG